MYLTELSAHWRAEADKTGNTALRRAADELDAALADILTLPGEWAEAATRAENGVRGGMASAARASATASTFRVAAGNLAGRMLAPEPTDELEVRPPDDALPPAQEPPAPAPPALAAPAPAPAPTLAAPAPALAASASTLPAPDARGLQAWDMTLPFDAASLGYPY